jgi:hypothetical protein
MMAKAFVQFSCHSCRILNGVEGVYNVPRVLLRSWASAPMLAVDQD